MIRRNEFMAMQLSNLCVSDVVFQLNVRLYLNV